MLAGGGDGTYGASKKGADIADLVQGSADAAFADRALQLRLLTPAAALDAALRGDRIWAGPNLNFFSSLNGVCSDARSVDASIVSIDTFAYWYNRSTGTKNQALMPPEWRAIFKLLNGVGRQSPATGYPDPHNLFFVSTTGLVSPEDGTTMTNALCKFDVAAEISVPGTGKTDGYLIDYTKYGGGFPFIKWTGGAGSGAVTITVTGKNQDNVVKTFTLSGTWAAGSFTATQTGVALVPQTADDLITDVTAIVVTGMTAGVMFIEAHAPSGRTYPST